MRKTILFLLILFLVGCAKEEIEQEQAVFSQVFIKVLNEDKQEIDTKITNYGNQFFIKKGAWINWLENPNATINIRYCVHDPDYYEGTDNVWLAGALRKELTYTCIKKAKDLRVEFSDKIREGEGNFSVKFTPEDGNFNDLTVCALTSPAFADLNFEVLQPYCPSGWSHCKNKAERCEENYTGEWYDCNQEMRECSEIQGKYCILKLPESRPTENCIHYGQNLKQWDVFTFKVEYKNYYLDQSDYATLYFMDKEGRRFGFNNTVEVLE